MYSTIKKKEKINVITYILVLFDKINKYHLLYLLIFLIPFLDKTDDISSNTIKRAIYLLFVISLGLIIITDFGLGLNEKRLKTNNLSNFVFITYLVFLLSCIYAFNITVAFVTFLAINFGILFSYIILQNLRTITQFRIINKIILLSSILIAVIAIFQYVTGQTFYRDIYPRINAVFWDPNIFGQYLVVINSILIPSIWFSLKHRNIKSGLFFVFSFLVFLSLSRTALITQFLIIASFLLLNKRYKLLLYLLLVSIPTGVAAYFILEKIRFINAVSDYESYLSILIRLDVMYGGLLMFVDNWLTGVGLNNFQLVFDQYTSLNMIVALEQYSIHSWPIQLLAEQGIFGLIVVLSLLFKINSVVVKLNNNVREQSIKIFLQGYYLAFLAFWIFGLTYHSFFRNEVFWLFTGLLFAIINFAYNREIKQ